MTRVSLVVAVAENGVIGSEGDMPWRLSTDLKRFKALTLGKPIIMGRKTFESIGKPLPGRTSIVVTREPDWQHPGAVPVSSIEAALDVARELAEAQNLEEVCIIGGGQIYTQTLALVDRLYVTQVHTNPDGDTVFPTIDPTVWHVVFEEIIPAGESDSAATTFRQYERRRVD